MINRRQFLQGLGTITALYANLPISSLIANEQSLLSRVIPKTGERIPIIGLGTSRTFHVDISDKAEMQKRLEVVSALLKRGGMIDSSPMYANAEDVIGKCIDQISMEIVQEKLFSASKVWSLNTRAGIREYAESEKLWREKQFDLMYVHNLLNWENHLKMLQAYKKEGRLRYTGITTSHRRRHAELQKIMKTEDIDFVQFSYSVDNRLAEEKLLPLAQEKEIAVVINRGFQTGHLFKRVEGKPLPDWASEIEVESWAQYFLKFIVSHPAVTVVIPATSNPAHMLENMAAASGPMPDYKMRAEMVKYFELVAV